MQGRYGVSVPALTKDHRGIKINTAYSRRIQRTQYAVFQIWNQYNILEDIKRSPYSKKSPIHHMALPPSEQRHRFLRDEGLEYTDSDIADFESRMDMEHRDKAGVVVFTSQAWRRLFDTRGPLLGRARRRLSWRQFILALGLHTGEEMKSPGFARYWSESGRMIPDKGDLHDYWRNISTDGDFLGPPLSYTLIRDPIMRLCHRMMAHSIAGRIQAPEKVTVTELFYLRGLDVGSVNIPYSLARYLRRFTAGRKSGGHIFSGQFVGRLAQDFRLLTVDILRGLTVITPELSMIDMAEMVILHICVQLDDTWAWVAMRPERTMPQRLGRLEEEVQGLRRDVRSLRGLVERSMTDQGRFSMWMMSCMTQLMDASGQTYQAFDGTFRGSSLGPFHRRVRQRIGEASTSAAQQDQQQPDP
ncbi:hypothetical protein Tco_1033791 [Tanacetum coccineum]